nr:hypothetical protein [uncultured bacterium]
MKILIVLVLASLLSVTSIARAESVDPPKDSAKPNVIFIKTDDQRFDSLTMTARRIARHFQHRNLDGQRTAQWRVQAHDV